MGHFTKRRWLVVLLGLTAVSDVFAVIAIVQWWSASHRSGQKHIEPFRIAGSLYYVDTNDVTAFLLTGREGHILIVLNAR